MESYSKLSLTIISLSFPSDDKQKYPFPPEAKRIYSPLGMSVPTLYCPELYLVNVVSVLSASSLFHGFFPFPENPLP